MITLRVPTALGDFMILDAVRASGGRAAAAGIAYQPPDFAAFGVPQRQRVRRTEEGVDILRKAWSGEPFSYESKYHTIEDVRVTPRPYQKGGPPIWLAVAITSGARQKAVQTGPPRPLLSVPMKPARGLRCASSGARRSASKTATRLTFAVGSLRE